MAVSVNSRVQKKNKIKFFFEIDSKWQPANLEDRLLYSMSFFYFILYEENFIYKYKYICILDTFVTSRIV